MKKLIGGILGLVLVFIALYAWFLPSNNATQVVLDMPANGISKAISITDDAKIGQTIHLTSNANTLIVPFESKNTISGGVVHLSVFTENHVLVFKTQEALHTSQQFDF
ncbi:MAG: hypothetical protein ABIP54_01430, partial [Candidatus Andersenbacteria bacterium]